MSKEQIIETLVKWFENYGVIIPDGSSATIKDFMVYSEIETMAGELYEDFFADLQSQLTEKETEIGFLEATTISMQEDINYWEKQVEEKEQELKKYKSIGATPRQLQRAYQERCKYNERCSELEKQHNRNKINFALEQLEKVKEEMTYNGNGYCEVRQCSSPYTPNLNFAWFNYVVFNKFIDNQIEELEKGLD